MFYKKLKSFSLLMFLYIKSTDSKDTPSNSTTKQKKKKTSAIILSKQFTKTVGNRLNRVEQELESMSRLSKIQQALYATSSIGIIALAGFLLWKWKLKDVFVKKKASDISIEVKNLIKEGKDLDKKYSKKQNT